MTNEEIITKEKQILGLDPFEPLHTFAKWKELGFKVKKGEHATVCTKLWKRKGKKVETEEKEEIEVNNFYLTKAYLFTLNQVELIQKPNIQA